MGKTHYSKFAGKIESRTSFPVGPRDGQMFYHSTRDIWYQYKASVTQWYGVKFDTTTSTSSSTTTTTTSTSTTTTSTSTTTTSTSTTTTTTSTSTTTTL